MIHVIADIQLAAGKRAEFLQRFADLVPQVFAEDGCIEYGPTIDVETSIDAQRPIQSDLVTVMEKWADLESLERHLIAPHMLAFRKSAGHLMQGLKIRIVEPANPDGQSG